MLGLVGGVGLLGLAGASGCRGDDAGTSAGSRPVENASSASAGEPPGPVEPLSLVVREEPWTFEGARGRVITTPSFRIFTTDDSRIVLERLPAFLEIAHDAHQRIAGIEGPEQPLETYILATRPQWASLTRQLTGPAAPTYLRIRAGGYALNGRAVLFNIGTQGTFATVAHEGWHQFTQRTMRAPLPLWLEEGYATLAEGFRWRADAPDLPMFRPWANVQRYDRLRELANAGRVRPLRTLLNDRPQDLLSAYSSEAALDYYAQVWALVHFLREGEGGKHRDALERLVEQAADGRLYETLAREAGRREATLAATRRIGSGLAEVFFDDDLSALNAEYEAFIRTIVSPGGRDKVVAGRSPIRG